MLYLDKLAYQTQSLAEHYAIQDACIAEDTAAASRTLKEHLLDASTSLVAYLNTTQGEEYGTV
jgi:DNA-binding GntR family transcriptional regulator